MKILNQEILTFLMLEDFKLDTMLKQLLILVIVITQLSKHNTSWFDFVY
jgi:hypothetical protein